MNHRAGTRSIRRKETRRNAEVPVWSGVPSR
jgi:hypothetical protein